MGVNTAPGIHVMMEGEARTFKVSFADVLDSGELLTGTPTVAEESTSDLTISSKVVNTEALTINNQTVAIGNAVQFFVSGQLLATGRYTITITCTTDSTPVSTVKGNIKIKVSSE